MARERAPEIEFPTATADAQAVDAAMHAFAELVAEMALAVPSTSSEVTPDAA